jgi:hypothetical protein
MDIILKWLVSGYVVGLVCMLFLMARAWVVTTLAEDRGVAAVDETITENETGQSWLGMALLSTAASLVWMAIGAGIYHLLKSRVLFMEFSLFVAIAVAIIFLLKKTAHRLDKIIINAIVVIGMSFLIPAMF